LSEGDAFAMLADKSNHTIFSELPATNISLQTLIRVAYRAAGRLPGGG
jgi:hypothetical protein